MCYTRKAVIHRLAVFGDLLTYLGGLSLICSPAFALNPNRHVSQYAHTAWRIQEGFFNGRAYIVAQTADGYLGCETAPGLLRLDGFRFIPWEPADGDALAHSAIHALHGSRDGSLWIGTREGLFRLKDKKLTHISDVPGPIVEIAEDREGVIWVARRRVHDTVGPICRIDGAKSRCLNDADG